MAFRLLPQIVRDGSVKAQEQALRIVLEPIRLQPGKINLIPICIDDLATESLQKGMRSAHAEFGKSRITRPFYRFPHQEVVRL